MTVNLDAYLWTWLGTLQYGTPGEQYIALLAIRSHGHEIDGVGYWQDLHYEWKPPGKSVFCIIIPNQTDVPDL